MTVHQSPNPKGNNKLLIVALAIASFLFLIYGYTQRQLASKLEERYRELEKKNLNLVNKNIETARKLETALNETNKMRMAAEQKLQECLESKRK